MIKGGSIPGNMVAHTRIGRENAACGLEVSNGTYSGCLGKNLTRLALEGVEQRGVLELEEVLRSPAVCAYHPPDIVACCVLRTTEFKCPQDPGEDVWQRCRRGGNCK